MLNVDQNNIPFTLPFMRLIYILCYIYQLGKVLINIKCGVCDFDSSYWVKSALFMTLKPNTHTLENI